MKVKDLIEKLKFLDPETTVLVNGYEGDFNVAEGLSDIKRFLPNPGHSWYMGNTIEYPTEEELKDSEYERDSLEKLINTQTPFNGVVLA